MLLGRTLLEQVDAFREGFGPAAVPTGLLRVGVAHAFLDWNGGRPVADAIGKFTAAFNQVTIRLSAGWTPSLIAELNQGASMRRLSLRVQISAGRRGPTLPR